MKKFTLFATVAVAMVAATVKADDKIIYQDNFTSLNWTTSRENNMMKLVETSDGNYLQIGDGSTTYNGTRYNSFWGSACWEGVELPESGYTLSFMFQYEQFGNNTSSTSQRNNEIAIWNVPAVEGLKVASYWGTTTEVMLGNDTLTAETGKVEGAGYLFKMTQRTDGTAAGEGGYASSATGTCYFNINSGITDSEDNTVNLAAAQWYKVTLTVKGQTVYYEIVTIDGTPFAAGSYTLAEGVDNRAGGIITYQARYLGILDFMAIKATYAFEGDVAADPQVLLSAVKGNDRDYKVTFNEGEDLHYILPGSEEEQTVDYWSAEDEVTGNPGIMTLTCTQSGTLKTWTTKGEATSNIIETEVSCGWIQLPAPVVSIASVSEGFGKSYTVSVDNSAVALSPVIALTYVFTPEGGSAQQAVEVANGGTITLTEAGTFVVTANSIPVQGVEYYSRNSTTEVNDVEYVCALDVEYHAWTEDHFDMTKWTKVTSTDTNTSHWGGRWMNAHPKGYTDGTDGVEDWWKAPSQVFSSIDEVNAYIWFMELTQDSANYATELLPIIPNSARASVTILSEEGIVANTTSYNYLEIYFDQKWVTDNEAKPNFFEIKKTGSYDRYDKQTTCHSTDIINTNSTDYTLYRYDTAINSIRVFTYKGFTPSEGIQAIENDARNEVAPIYNLRGERVENMTTPGFYIQNGKVMIVK